MNSGDVCVRYRNVSGPSDGLKLKRPAISEELDIPTVYAVHFQLKHYTTSSKKCR